MKLEIVSRTKEPHLKREKIEVKVFFEGEPIPSKQSIIDNLLVIDGSLVRERIIVRKVETHFGRSDLLATLYYYDSLNILKQTEHDYIIKRNKTKESAETNVQQTAAPVASEDKK